MKVVSAGPLSLVEDLGRPTAAHLGAPISGAFDRDALRLANRLLGNPEGAAAIETMFDGLVLEIRERTWIAITGAVGEQWIDDTPVPAGSALLVQAGAHLRLGPVHRGVRRIVAVRGGIDVPPELGARATDTRTGTGPAPLRAGDMLPIGAAATDPVPQLEPVLSAQAERAVRILPGPRVGWFTRGAHEALVGERFDVTPFASRAGVRLDGPPLPRAVPGELESEGMLFGAIQVTPRGPVVLGPDHPTTGGYPVIAVVVEADLPLIAQAAPGDTLRFRHASRAH